MSRSTRAGAEPQDCAVPVQRRDVPPRTSRDASLQLHRREAEDRVLHRVAVVRTVGLRTGAPIDTDGWLHFVLGNGHSTLRATPRASLRRTRWVTRSAWASKPDTKHSELLRAQAAALSTRRGRTCRRRAIHVDCGGYVDSPGRRRPPNDGNSRSIGLHLCNFKSGSYIYTIDQNDSALPQVGYAQL